MTEGVINAFLLWVAVCLQFEMIYEGVQYHTLSYKEVQPSLSID